MNNPREIKFRAWDKDKNDMRYKANDRELTPENLIRFGDCIERNLEWMQFTGLKDKNGLIDLYEGDIIDETGNLKGNIYEVHKGKTDLVIQGFGTKDWVATYQEAMARGCKNAE